jgi:hypothetical protein
MPGFRMPRQFLSFGAGDGLYGGSVFVWVNYESPFELERGERNRMFFSLCQICAGLNCDIAAVTKGIPHRRTAPK